MARFLLARAIGSTTRMLSALLLLWICPGLPLQRAGAQPGSEPARADRAREPEERRILTLVDGRKLRGVTRLCADGWELRDGSVWLVLPEGLVASAASEREL